MKAESELKNTTAENSDGGVEKKSRVIPSRQLEQNEAEFDQKMFRVVLRLLVFVTMVLLTIITRFWGLADPPHIW